MGALVEDREDPRGKSAIKLPGTKKGDLSARAGKPQVMVTGLEFSPTGREFAAATTEGLLMYSLDSKMIFDPFEFRCYAVINIIPLAESNRSGCLIWIQNITHSIQVSSIKRMMSAEFLC